MMRATMLAALAALTLADGAFAQNPRNAVMTAERVGPTKPGKTVSKVRQPVGTPHKANSFAPRPTGKRVFGDPIQAPIVRSTPAPK